MPRTKIVATLGPATASPDGIARLIEAGANVFRLNMAHGDHPTHRQSVRWIREAAGDRSVAILGDLAGPKIRVGTLPEPVALEEGARVVLAPEETAGGGEIPTTYPALAEDVRTGARVLLADGLMELTVTSVEEARVHCQVVHGGTLESGKGINLPGTQVSAPSLTEKDRADLAVLLEEGVEYVGLSFVRRAEDVRALKALTGPDGPYVVAKIEKDTALAELEDIITASDGVMVARGDLGVELPFRKVPAAQKKIIARAVFHARPVITATQMLESMIDNPRPTRAEANDVANAVYDSSDAVMLSGETAVGAYPVSAVEAMREIIEEVEGGGGREFHQPTARPIDRRHVAGGTTTEHAVAAATVDGVRMVDAPAIVTLTATGFTARLVASYRPTVPIIAVSRDREAVRKLALVRGVLALYTDSEDNEEAVGCALSHILRTGLGSPGERVIITTGILEGQSRGTNMFRVEEL